ncbi:MAG TPA: hypothetical protein VJ870_18515 [Amycolatopsis sp.]|nr:hypothetical protein [Amycolatopsis sp.]
MVGKARQLIGATAARFAAAIDDELVTYTPGELNRLIDTITAREIAGRLREGAAWHREQATADREALSEQGYRAAGRTSLRAGWHTAEADRLEDAATHELARLGRGERA